MLKRYNFKNYRILLILYLCALTIIGILVIGSAKESVQNKQILGFVLGLIVMTVISFIDYSFLLKFPWVFYACAIVVMLLVNVFYWWNPLVWVATHLMKKDMEMS